MSSAKLGDSSTGAIRNRKSGLYEIHTLEGGGFLFFGATFSFSRALEADASPSFGRLGGTAEMIPRGMGGFLVTRSRVLIGSLLANVMPMRAGCLISSCAKS